MNKQIDLLIQVPDQPAMLLVSPESLQDLLSKLTSATSRPESSISLLYNRKSTWFKILDNDTYTSIISKTISSGLDEIELKIEFSDMGPVEEAWDLMSNISHIVPEETKEDPVPESFVVHEQPQFDGNSSLYYRFLNGPSTEKWNKLTIDDLEITLQALSETIVEKESFSVNDWTCAFFTEDGNPLTGTLSQMPHHLCSEFFTFGAKLTLFIVPAFDLKSWEKIAPGEAPNTITVQHLTDENKSFTFKVNIETSKVIELKQVLYYFTGIPTYELRLKCNDSYLARNEALISEYGIIEGQKLLFEKVEREIGTFSYKPYNKVSVEQTKDGMTCLHSFLHSFGKLVEISEKPIRESLLGYVRHFTKNCSPYVMSLYQLSKSQPLSILNTIALEEGSLIVLRTVLREVLKEAIDEDKLFEHIIEVFGLLCDLSSSQSEELSRDEVYKEYEITCPLSSTDLVDPVLIKRTDLKVMYYEHSELLKKIKADEEVKFVGKLKEIDLKIDENFRFAVKRCTLNKTESAFFWEGIFDTTKSIGQLVAEKHPQGITLKKCVDLKRAYKITKPVPPLSLKSTENRDCMTFNKSKELVVSLGPSNKEPNKVDLMSILTRNVSMVDIDDLASAIEMRNPGQVGQEVITRNPDEAIVVVFDVSGSMGTKFFDDPDFNRLDATKEFFETFTDRNAGFDYAHVISLLLFSTNMTRACGFTENIVTFSAHIQNAQSGGGTKLWDALNLAIEYLKEFKNTYPNAHLRILCLSDGEDTSSQNNYTAISKSLVLNNVTLDSIVVGALSQQLKAASFASGGYVFLPRTIQEGIKLFESETFLSVRARTVPSRTLVNSEADLIPLLSKDFSNAQPISSAAPKEINSKTVSISTMMAKISSQGAPVLKGSSGPSGGAMKRITKEISELSSNPHPSFTVYPTENDITFWNVIMTGPDTTPYEGGTYHMYVKLPSDYPFKPPTVKFVTQIYHCNINSQGSICHSILKDQWSPAITVRKVFDYIYGLLLTPEPLDPLDANIATEYRVDFELFLQHAKEHTAIHASKSEAEILAGLQPAHTQPPPQFLCGITGNIMTDPVIVVKSNNSYERAEIEKVVNTTGLEPKTGEQITMADLITNVSLMCAIQEFHKLNGSTP